MSKLWRVGLVSEAAPEMWSDVEVRALRGIERLGALYELDVEVVARDRRLDTASVLGVPLTVELWRTATDLVRRIHGIAAVMTDCLTTEVPTPVYRFRLVPRLWRLSLTRTTEIFMDLEVPEIIAAKLERAGMSRGADFELRLRSSYPRQEYLVQYDETDVDFVRRLAEHAGITLFFEQHEDREVAVFTDHNEGFRDLAGGGGARFYPRGDHIGVFELTSTVRSLPTRYMVKDYNYRTPQIALLAETHADEGAGGHVYEYGAHFKTPEDAERVARIRAEEAACRRTLLEGSSNDVRFAPGVMVRLEGHPLGDRALLLTEVRHDYEDVVLMHGSAGARPGYRNAFEGTPAEAPFRPPRVTPKPRISGSITAQIEASGDGPYADLDAEGRYRVRFSFDVADSPRATATRLVRMAQPHAGPGYGFHFPLRHGVEVLITFIDGDPDRPIISSAVPNPQTPSVVGAGNGTRNIIRTGAGNEINIDDTAGAERIKISTPHGGSSFQIGAPNTPSAGASLSTADSWNAVAQSGATTASTAVSVFSDIASLFASADIIGFAGAANILSALASKAPDIVKKVAEIADGTMDTAANVEAARVAEAQDAAKTARDEGRHWESRRREYQAKYGSRAPTGLFDDEIAACERRARAHDETAEQLERQKKANDEARDDVKKYTKWAKTGAELVKGTVDAKGEYKDVKDQKGAYPEGRDTWSKASKVAAKAAGTVAAGAAAMAAAAGSGFAAVARIPGTVPAPGSPMNIQGAANGAALVGGATAMLAAPHASVVGSGQAVLAGGGSALVKSPGAAEVSGMGRALITSGALVDLKSSGAIKTFSGAATKVTAGSNLKMNAGAKAALKAGGNVLVQSGGNATTRAVSVDLKASGALNEKAGGDMGLKAGGAVKVDAGGHCQLNAGGNARIKGAKASLESGSSSLHLTGNANLKSGGTVSLKGGGAASLQGSTVTIKGGTVMVKGTMKASGRCLLG